VGPLVKRAGADRGPDAVAAEGTDQKRDERDQHDQLEIIHGRAPLVNLSNALQLSAVPVLLSDDQRSSPK
jgi:hypothetical protein